MAFHPATLELLAKYGHGTGLADENRYVKKPPRPMRPQQQAQPNPLYYAPGSPLAQLPGEQPQQKQSALQVQGLLPQLGPGANQATLGMPAAMKHPVLSSDYFDDQSQGA